MKYKVIDAHVHPFTAETGRNVARFGFPVTVEEFIGELRNIGISGCCGSFIEPAERTDFSDIERLNRAALQLREKYPEFYIPGIYVHGEYPDESSEMLGSYYRDGVRWIGELVTHSMKLGRYNSVGMKKVCEKVCELGMVLNLHVNAPDLEDLADLLETFPELKVVLAHPGDGEAFTSRLEMVKKYANLYLDISGTGLFRWGMLRYVIDQAGIEKVIFGSDFPVCSPGMNLHGVLSEHLTETEFEAVLGGNFKRLINA